MKPGPKKTQIQGMYAIALGKSMKTLLTQMEPFCDGRSIGERTKLLAIANWLDGSNRTVDLVQPFIRPKPIKAKKRRAYSQSTQDKLTALGMRLDAGDTIISACYGEAVERSRFERYLRREGYGALIDRNQQIARDKQAAERAAKASKPKPQLGRPTNYPARR